MANETPTVKVILRGFVKTEIAKRIFEVLCNHGLGEQGENVNWSIEFDEDSETKKIEIHGPPFYSNLLENTLTSQPFLMPKVEVISD